MVLEVVVFYCGFPLILQVIAEKVVVLWHNCLAVPNRGGGEKGRAIFAVAPSGRFQRAAKLAAK